MEYADIIALLVTFIIAAAATAILCLAPPRTIIHTRLKEIRNNALIESMKYK